MSKFGILSISINRQAKRFLTSTFIIPCSIFKIQKNYPRPPCGLGSYAKISLLGRLQHFQQHLLNFRSAVQFHVLEIRHFCTEGRHIRMFFHLHALFF